MSIETLKRADKTVGAKQTSKAILRNDVQQVYIASDSDDRISQPLWTLCEEHGIPVCRDYTLDVLGKACGLKVKAAAVGILKSR